MGSYIPPTPEAAPEAAPKNTKVRKPRVDTVRASSYPANLRTPGTAPKEKRVRRPSEISQAFKGKRRGTGTRTTRRPLL